MDSRITPLIAAALSALSDLVAEAVRPAVAAALADSLPEVLRRASLPLYLTKQQVRELTGWSPRKVDYIVAECRIPVVRRGRTVLFKAADIEAYLQEGYVPAVDAKRGGKRS